MDQMRGIVSSQGLDAADGCLVLPWRFRLPGFKESVRISCWQGGGPQRVTVDDRQGPGRVAGCTCLTVGREVGVEGGDEVWADEAVESLPAVD